MRLSDDKISHTTHVVLKGLLEKNAITPLADDGQIRREIRRVIVKELKLAEDKKIYEGSSEWEVMYNKLFEEETAKKGRDMS
ncbi:MAG: hypothetical protein AMK70_01785 [Nitrospira bacterium SG8_35_1]|nr:MAG: hypothetical protein AMK70_01785 [Nitrospira bacterium SG8_35_1]